MSAEEIRQFQFYVYKNHIDLYIHLPSFLRRVQESTNQQSEGINEFDEFSVEEKKLFCIFIIYKSKKQMIESLPPMMLIKEGRSTDPKVNTKNYKKRIIEKGKEIIATHLLIELLKQVFGGGLF
jgi:hypothetical protein